MRRTVDVGIVPGIELRGGVNHRLRFLRGGGVIEPDERLAVDQLMQGGKIATHAFNVKLGNGRGGFGIRLAGERRFSGNIPAAQKIIFRRGQ